MTSYSNFTKQFSRGNLLNLIPSLISGFGATIALVFFAIALITQDPVFAILSNNGNNENKQLETALTVIVGLTSASVVLQVTYHMTTLFPIKESIDKLGESDVFIGTSELYGKASRDRIVNGRYASLDVYAPTALWKPNDEKKLWLQTVLSEAKRGLTVRFVFGLPRDKQQWNVMKEILIEYFDKADNVQVAYQAPLPENYPDSAMGVAIAMTDKHDFVGSWILFALASDADAVLTDTGISHTNINVVVRSRDWFYQKIWEPCLSNSGMLFKPSPNDPSMRVTIAKAVSDIEKKYPYLGEKF